MSKPIDSPPSDQDSQADRWFYRRRVVFLSLLFTAYIVGYLTIFGKDDSLRKEIVSDLLSGQTWVILGYTFGAMIDDNMRTGKFGANFICHKMDCDSNNNDNPDDSSSVGFNSSSQPGADNHGP